MLLNIHPQPRTVAVAIRTDGRLLPLGEGRGSALVKVPPVRALVAEAIAAGWFAREATTAFPFMYYFESVDALLAYTAERWTSLVIEDAVLARARETLAAGCGELTLCEYIYAERLRRLERDGN